MNELQVVIADCQLLIASLAANKGKKADKRLKALLAQTQTDLATAVRKVGGENSGIEDVGTPPPPR